MKINDRVDKKNLFLNLNKQQIEKNGKLKYNLVKHC